MIRGFQPRDAACIAGIYHNAIMNIDKQLYSPSQLQAWSAAPRSKRYWLGQLTQTQSWVVIQGEQCVGFINCVTRYPERGYIEHLYILPQYQGRSLSKALFQQLEQWAYCQGYPKLSAHASKVSRPIFEHLGFRVSGKVYQQKRGQTLLCYEMEKQLD